ncbi:hypothetical protein SAMN05421803_1472 [Nocardiopsis flavescens]|uniref:Uncharacterized protein n=1 Tax=Nocardiopsis flavescens TaxID=758803 RepID=A0A1M6WMU6_9ACTN|nr:hypothetical protein SAMN05421803_1472 [Nocardiopsis flavescens]
MPRLQGVGEGVPPSANPGGEGRGYLPAVQLAVFRPPGVLSRSRRASLPRRVARGKAARSRSARPQGVSGHAPACSAPGGETDLEASRTVTRWKRRSVVAPDQNLWLPRRPPLGKVQTGGAGSAPTIRRAADGRASTWGARPGWWGCAVRGRVRARPALPDHAGTEEWSDRGRAVAPDLAWNTSPRRSNQHPSALPHHDAPSRAHAGARGLHSRAAGRAGSRGLTPRDLRSARHPPAGVGGSGRVDNPRWLGGAGVRGFHPQGFAEPSTPSSTPWGRGGDQR